MLVFLHYLFVNMIPKITNHYFNTTKENYYIYSGPLYIFHLPSDAEQNKKQKQTIKYRQWLSFYTNVFYTFIQM